MPTPLKQHHEQKEDLQQKQNSSPKFKTFQYIDHENERFQELVFFCRFNGYCVILFTCFAFSSSLVILICLSY